MRLPSTVALVAALALLPAAARADDWETENPGWNEPPAEGYDVSVDVNPGGVTLDTFQAPLAPYGDWVYAGQYGQVWRPRVAAGWRPYYYGRWEWTNEGWLWVSDEPWGWAAYHYGRWAYDTYHGWIWVPGYQWAPAWVSWRYSGDVIGWAPLAPGLSLYVSTYPFVDFWWTFVPTVRFVSTPVYHVAYAPSYTRQWYYRSAPAPARPAPRPGARTAPAPSPAWGGPAPRFVSEKTGRAIAPARIVAAPSPGARARPGEIAIFRPETRGAAGHGSAAVPEPARRGGSWSPPSRGNGRGPGAVPAPGRGGQREGDWAPPSGGERGRGPGVVPAPARGGDGGGPAPSGGGSAAPSRGGSPPAPAPARPAGRQGRAAPAEAEPRGGRSSSAVAPAPARGGHSARGDRGERGERGERDERERPRGR